MNEHQNPEPPNADYKPKSLSFRQNLILTVKVLAGAGILLTLLWFGGKSTAQ